MSTLTQLEYIVSVDRYRHFGKAARACHVSQPSLSMQIQKLEDELEIRIFDRSKKPILLTAEGKEVVEQAKVVLREHRKLTQITRESDRELKGEFRLAVIPTLAPYLVPLFIESFSTKYPKVELFIEELQTEEILRLLDGDRIDAGLLVIPLHEEGVLERSLFFEPFYVYIHDAHPLSKKGRVREEDLDGSEIWLLSEGHCMRGQMVRICSLRKKSKILKNVRFESGNLETLRHLVDRDGGYTLLPDLAVRRIRDPKVRSLIKPFKRPWPTREVGLVHSRHHHKLGILKALEAEILSALPEDLRKIKKQEIEVVDL